MPQQTVYIRNDDMPKWKAIEHKSQFIADALEGLAPEPTQSQRPPLSNIPGITTADKIIYEPIE